MESIDQRIERFCGHFHRHVATAEDDVAAHGEDEVYSRMIICTTLDTVAKVAYPSVKHVGDRFVQLVSTAANWPDAERVSLLHLARAVDSEPSDFGSLSTWARSELSSLLPELTGTSLAMHPADGKIPISGDPLLQEVESRWPVNSSGSRLRTRDKLRAENLTHARLLYQCRNRLVHEMLVPGGGWDTGVTRIPHYQIIAEADDTLTRIEKRWELIYPLAFLAEKGRNAIESLRLQLLVEQRSPFDSFKWGSYWLDQLN